MSDLEVLNPESSMARFRKATKRKSPARTRTYPTKRRWSTKAPVRRARRTYGKKNPLGTAHTKEWGTVIAISAGGALAGLVEGMQDRGQIPDIPGGIEPSLLIGAAMVAIPVSMKMKGRNATYAALLGTGMLAAAAKDYVSNMYAPAEVAVQTAAELAEY